MSESTVQAELQAVIATLEGFDESADVSIGDWSVLDRPIACAPYAVIRRSQRVSTAKHSLRGFKVTWQVPVVLVVAFDDWDQAENDLGELRQSFLQLLLVQHPRIGDFAIEEIRDGSDFDGIFAANDGGPYPTFLSQELIVVISELV